jgi:hypothetical protein
VMSLICRRLLWTNGSTFGANTLVSFWKCKAVPHPPGAPSAPPEVQISSAPTALEQTYSAGNAYSMCTRDLLFIDSFDGLEGIMLRHHYILLDFCYALHIMVTLVRGQLRYDRIKSSLFALSSFMSQGTMAEREGAGGVHRMTRTRRAASTSIQGIEEEDESQMNTTTHLPTPRGTPQPDIGPQIPDISDTLFDSMDMSADFGKHHAHKGRHNEPLITVVDSQGVFEMEVLFCACSDKESRDQQLLRAGLFPATFKQIETVFTFSVLDNFLTDNLECKTTAQQYYSKLQSMTSYMFPDHIPVRSPFVFLLNADITLRTDTNNY